MGLEEGQDWSEGFCLRAGTATLSRHKMRTEDRGLATLRDASLPKLMSGEIDISDVELTGGTGEQAAPLSKGVHIKEEVDQPHRHDSVIILTGADIVMCNNKLSE